MPSCRTGTAPRWSAGTVSIDWLCFPRFDSPSTFGRLLGEERRSLVLAGRRPDAREQALPGPHDGVGDHAAHLDRFGHDYRRTGHGFWQPGPRTRPSQRRTFSCGAPRVRRGGSILSLEYAPRPDYGLNAPSLRRRRRGMRGLRQRRRAGALDARGPDARPGPRRGLGPVPAGRGRTALASPCITGTRPRAARPGSGTSRRYERRLEDTVVAWESWSELHQAYVGPWQDTGAPQRPGAPITLLCRPPGLSARRRPRRCPRWWAAPRNWDYRYAWVRDASFTDPGPVGGGLPRRSQSVLRLRLLVRGRLARPGRRLADHVRHRR